MARDDWSVSWDLLMPAWARRNPAITLTALYLFVSAMGVTYSLLYYGPFGINIFDFAEPSDFFLMPFRHPHSLLASVILVFFYVVFHLIYWRPASVRYREAFLANDVAAYKEILIEGREDLSARSKHNPIEYWMIGGGRFDRKTEALKASEIGRLHFESARAFMLVVVPVGFMAIIYLALSLYLEVATSTSHAVRMGAGVKDTYILETADGKREVEAVLVGTTNRYLFLFDGLDGRVLVVPNDSLIGIRMTSVN